GSCLVIEQQVASLEISRIRFPVGRRRCCSPLADSNVDATCNGLPHVRLQINDVCGAAVETLRPDMHLISYPDKLCRNPNPGAGFAHATFQRIIYAEFVPDLINALATVLVLD